jgi:hypothetical protein
MGKPITVSFNVPDEPPYNKKSWRKIMQDAAKRIFSARTSEEVIAQAKAYAEKKANENDNESPEDGNTTAD